MHQDAAFNNYSSNFIKVLLIAQINIKEQEITLNLALIRWYDFKSQSQPYLYGCSRLKLTNIYNFIDKSFSKLKFLSRFKNVDWNYFPCIEQIRLRHRFHFNYSTCTINFSRFRITHLNIHEGWKEAAHTYIYSSCMYIGEEVSGAVY